jgi:predicted RNase H-like HicB family nuclease
LARYQVCLEVGEDGTCMAHVPELLGCFAVGSTREEALQRLRGAIAEYLAWLAKHREAPAPSNESERVEIEVVEEVSTSGSYPRKAGEPVAFLAADQEPMSYHDLQTAVRLMEHARRDLLEFLRDVPDSLLHWRPGPDEPSIAETLLHMAQVEASYLARLEEESQQPPFPQLAAVRSWAYHRLSRLTEAELSRLTTHRGERWSARKVLRRFLEHDWEQTAYIRSLLARYHRNQPNS